jgi:hypothetical protein
MECLILVAKKNGPRMLARIGVMRALNRHVERVFNPDRKDALGKAKTCNLPSPRDMDRNPLEQPRPSVILE